MGSAVREAARQRDVALRRFGRDEVASRIEGQLVPRTPLFFGAQIAAYWGGAVREAVDRALEDESILQTLAQSEASDADTAATRVIAVLARSLADPPVAGGQMRPAMASMLWSGVDRAAILIDSVGARPSAMDALGAAADGAAEATGDVIDGAVKTATTVLRGAAEAAGEIVGSVAGGIASAVAESPVLLGAAAVGAFYVAKQAGVF
ncbi:MAG: hypothetical protein D6744_07375 [Planctomycetota bacterium]|nr:MAG: hypothetical protein D6744_07375 [Planctomycetota bacterium]